jgi:hypothetical protein
MDLILIPIYTGAVLFPGTKTLTARGCIKMFLNNSLPILLKLKTFYSEEVKSKRRRHSLFDKPKETVF